MNIGVLTGGGDCPGLNAVIRAIVRKAATQDYRFSSLLTGVVLSEQFRFSRSPELARSTP